MLFKKQGGVRQGGHWPVERTDTHSISEFTSNHWSVGDSLVQPFFPPLCLKLFPAAVLIFVLLRKISWGIFEISQREREKLFPNYY